MTTSPTTVFNSPTKTASRTGNVLITPEQARLGDYLNKAHVRYDFDFTVPRDGGKPPYRIDLMAYDEVTGEHPKLLSRTRVGIEIWGEGTSSDDADRDIYIKSQGIPLLYYPNKLVMLYTGYVVTDVKLALSTMRRFF